MSTMRMNSYAFCYSRARETLVAELLTMVTPEDRYAFGIDPAILVWR